MIESIYKSILKFLVNKLYATDAQREELKIAINNDTHKGSYVNSGGHLLSSLNPISDYEIISILNALKHGNQMKDGAKSSKKETYYKEIWS